MRRFAPLLLFALTACHDDPAAVKAPPAAWTCADLNPTVSWSWADNGTDTTITMTVQVTYDGPCMDDDGRGYASFRDEIRVGHTAMVWQRVDGRLQAWETFFQGVWSQQDTIRVWWAAQPECSEPFRCDEYEAKLIAREVLAH